MKTIVRLALVDPDEASRSQIKSLMLGFDNLWLEAECSRYDLALDQIRQTRPDLALINLDADHITALSLVAKLSRELPECQILAVSSAVEGTLRLQAVQQGAGQFLTLPLRQADLIAAFQASGPKQVPTENTEERRAGQVIAVAGAAGGVGCTGLAVNLGCELARSEHNRAVIVDLDFALGSADLWLDLVPQFTIQDAIDNLARLDEPRLTRSLARHACGLFLLPRPIQFQDCQPMIVEQVRRVIALLKTAFTHVVIDLSKAYSANDMAALEAAETVLLITQLDLPCLRNGRRLLEHFDRIPGLANKIRIVANRVGCVATQFDGARAREILGREIWSQIPDDVVTMSAVQNSGMPMIWQAPRSKLTRAIAQMAHELDRARLHPFSAGGPAVLMGGYSTGGGLLPKIPA